MLVIIGVSSGNRFIGEVNSEEMPTAGKELRLAFPAAYIEQVSQQGAQIGMPPAVLSVPVKEMSVVPAFVIAVEGGPAQQLKDSYEQATRPARAALQGLVVVPAGAMPRGAR